MCFGHSHPPMCIHSVTFPILFYGGRDQIIRVFVVFLSINWQKNLTIILQNILPNLWGWITSSGFMVDNVEIFNSILKNDEERSNLSVFSQKKRKPIPDLNLTCHPAQTRVIHNHISGLLFELSGFIISHFELTARFFPTTVAFNYDNSNSQLVGIWLCVPTFP